MHTSDVLSQPTLVWIWIMTFFTREDYSFMNTLNVHLQVRSSFCCIFTFCTKVSAVIFYLFTFFCEKVRALFVIAYHIFLSRNSSNFFMDMALVGFYLAWIVVSVITICTLMFNPRMLGYHVLPHVFMFWSPVITFFTLLIIAIWEFVLEWWFLCTILFHSKCNLYRLLAEWKTWIIHLLIWQLTQIFFLVICYWKGGGRVDHTSIDKTLTL